METGLYYNWHRYYDQKSGRYMRPDPIGLIGGVDLYSYVKNNAINFIDPIGLARYNVYWNYESVSIGAPIGAAGVKISGLVISMKRSCEGKCKGLYEAAKFEGYLFGVSMGAPVGGCYNNQEVFEDNYDNPDVGRVGGMSWALSGTIAAHKWGKSGGGYQFGELRGTNENVSDVDQGYDLGVDYVGGKLRIVGDTFCVESPSLLQK